jgi:hypothetical protein
VAAELEAGTLVVVGTRRRAIVNRVSLVRVLDKVPSRAEKTFVRFFERWPPTAGMGSGGGWRPR